MLFSNGSVIWGEDTTEIYEDGGLRGHQNLLERTGTSGAAPLRSATTALSGENDKKDTFYRLALRKADVKACMISSSPVTLSTFFDASVWVEHEYRTDYAGKARRARGKGAALTRV